MLKDCGYIEISGVDDANIPVNCFLEEESGVFVWTADNFMPRKGRISEESYRLESDSKEEIMSEIRKYVVPLYKIAVENLSEHGKLYYWHKEEASLTPTIPGA